MKYEKKSQGVLKLENSLSKMKINKLSASENPLVVKALNAILFDTEDMIFIKDKNSVYQFASPAFAKLVNLDNQEQIIGKTDFDIFDDHELARRYVEDDNKLFLNGCSLLNYTEPLPPKDGRARFGSTSKYILKDDESNIIGICGICHDITLEYEAKINYEREIKHLFELPDNALFAGLFDITGWRLVEMRLKGESLTLEKNDSTIEQFIQETVNSIYENDNLCDFLLSLNKENIYEIYESGKRNFTIEHQRYLLDGSLKWVRNYIHFLIDPVNGHLNSLIVIHDIEEEVIKNRQLKIAAEHDLMTGLFNRDATMNKIDEFLKNEGALQVHALFIIDIDNFKQVNDRFGHQTGDKVIINIAEQIKHAFRPTDIAGRVGGDEFFALMKDVKHFSHAQKKAKQLVNVLQHICSTPGELLEISGSVGITFYQGDYKSLEELYKEADIALYSAKQLGKNQFYIFDKDINDSQLFLEDENYNINTFNLHEMFNKIDAGIIVLKAIHRNPLVRPVYISESFLAMFDNMTMDYAFKHYSDTRISIHPEDHERVLVAFDNFLLEENGSTLRIEFRTIGNNNEYYWVSYGAHIVVNEDSSMDIYAVYTRIDHLMKTEEELREKNRIVELAMQTVDINLSFYDYKTKRCMLTENAKRVHGFDVDYLDDFPQCLFDINYVREDCVPLFKEAFDKLFKGEKNVSVDIWYRKNKLTDYWCERVVFTPIFNKNQEPVRAIAIGKDITALKEIEEKYRIFKNFARKDANDVTTCFLNLTLDKCIGENDFCNVFDKIPEQLTATSIFEYAYSLIRDEQLAKEFYDHFEPNNLLKSFAMGKNVVVLECRHFLNKKREVWLRTNIEMIENPNTNDIEAFVRISNVDNEKNMQLMIETLINTDYELLCQLNVNDGTISLFEENSKSKKNYVKERKYSNALPKILAITIAEEYIEEALQTMSFENVKEQLQDLDVFTCAFPAKRSEHKNDEFKQWRFSYMDNSKLIILICQTDITDIVLSQRDMLTGLYGHQAFNKFARITLDNNPNTNFALIRFDLDRFKTFNDAMGSVEGDKLLAEMGRIVKTHFMKQNCVFGRIEADHFVGLITIDEFDVLESSNRYNKLLNDYSKSMRVSVSTGIYLVEDKDVDVSLMCDRALLALKTIKEKHSEKVAFYDDGLRQKLMDEQNLITDMYLGLERNEFVVYLQPQIDYENKVLIGAEALVRWNHPTRGLLFPDSFIPLFEKNGFITNLDKYVWEKTCQYISKWLKSTGKLFNVSINISRLDFFDLELCNKLQSLVNKYEIPASALKLEITESAYMASPELLIETVVKLQKIGFSVELDDFGSGYSSLTTLNDVPVDILKLDVRFLSETYDDVRRQIILSSMIKMSAALNVPVIAEGVETNEQAQYLSKLDCNLMQGYYFGRPMPVEEFEKMMNSEIII